jgi:hypothetical protein
VLVEVVKQSEITTVADQSLKPLIIVANEETSPFELEKGKIINESNL